MSYACIAVPAKSLKNGREGCQSKPLNVPPRFKQEKLRMLEDPSPVQKIIQFLYRSTCQKCQ